MESIIEIVPNVLIVLLFPLGILIGYRWRDRISQQRRAQFLAERTERERRGGNGARKKSLMGDSTN